MTPSPSVDDLRAVVAEPDALVAVLAEDERLPVLEHERVIGLASSFSVRSLEGAVVEDVAVLEDLDERRALVRVRAPDDLLEVLRLDVDRCGRRSSRSAPSASAIGSNGWSTEPAGVDFVTLPTSDVGEYCPFVRP